MEAAALVYDLHGNPVADTTYVYWNIDVSPQDANDTIDVQIQGVSFTNNQNINGDSYSGKAFTKIIYPSHGISDWARIKAYTYGAEGVIVIDSVENDAIMAYYGDNLLLISTVTYWDFSTMGLTATAQLVATLTDHYGNPVENGRIQFIVPAGTIFGPNPALTDENGQAGIVVQWDSGVCAAIPNSDPQLYQDFTASCVAILLDPMPITSDPVDVLLVRTYQLPNPPANGTDDSTK